MLWLAAYLTGFPPFGLHALSWTHGLAPMWSGLYLISTEKRFIPEMGLWSACQCPLGLIPHFYFTPDGKYIEWTGTYCVNALSGLYLISTVIEFESFSTIFESVNALSGLYLISTVPIQKPRFYAVSRACFCRYLSEYSDNSRFSCMLTFWTYLMRCTYP